MEITCTHARTKRGPRVFQNMPKCISIRSKEARNGIAGVTLCSGIGARGFIFEALTDFRPMTIIQIQL